MSIFCFFLEKGALPSSYVCILRVLLGFYGATRGFEGLRGVERGLGRVYSRNLSFLMTYKYKEIIMRSPKRVGFWGSR